MRNLGFISNNPSGAEQIDHIKHPGPDPGTIRVELVSVSSMNDKFVHDMPNSRSFDGHVNVHDKVCSVIFRHFAGEVCNDDM